MALNKACIFFKRQYKMGCLVYKSAGLFILQALHWTVGKVPDPSLSSYCTSKATRWSIRKFQEKKKKIWLLWASMQRREKPNTILLSFSSKSNRKVIYKHISNITWHIHIFKLKMLSISSYLSEHMSFNINFALTRFTFISPFIIPM